MSSDDLKAFEKASIAAQNFVCTFDSVLWHRLTILKFSDLVKLVGKEVKEHNEIKLDNFYWQTTFDLFIVTGRLISNNNQRLQVITTVFEDENNKFKSQLSTKDNEIKSLKQKLATITNVRTEISQEQEKLFTSILRQKRKLSKNDDIVAKNVHGRPIMQSVNRLKLAVILLVQAQSGIAARNLKLST